MRFRLISSRIHKRTPLLTRHRLDTQCSGTQSELTTIVLRDQRSYTYFLDLPHIEVRTLAATARSSNQSSSAAPHSMCHQSGRRGSSLLVNEPPPPTETPYTSNPRSSHPTIQQANSLHSSYKNRKRTVPCPLDTQMQVARVNPN